MEDEFPLTIPVYYENGLFANMEATIYEDNPLIRNPDGSLKDRLIITNPEPRYYVFPMLEESGTLSEEGLKMLKDRKDGK